MEEIRDLILKYTGHFSFDGKTLEVMVGDHIATVQVDPKLNLKFSYLWPIEFALQKLEAENKITNNALALKPLSVNYQKVEGTPVELSNDVDTLKRLWFALEQHKNSIAMIDPIVKEMRQSMYRAASILLIGKVIEFEVQT